MEEDIVKPIEDLRKEKEMRKAAAKRVTTTRVVMYILAGLALFGILLQPTPNGYDGAIETKLTGAMIVVILLIPVFVSYKKPFTGILTMTIVMLLASFYQLFGILTMYDGDIPKLIGTLLGQGAIAWVMIRGTINAKKIRDIQRS